jgi:(p)ppGpp synthase/HD superfamily hydrolase
MPWSQDKYTQALGFAAEAHGDQQVPGKPYSYVVHLASVSMEIMSVLAYTPHLNADLAIQCALLHDVLEDSDTSESVLKAEFGPEVAGGVRALAKNKKLPPSERLKDSLHRILGEPVEIGMVKMADRISNLAEPPEHWFEDKITDYLEEAKVIYHSLRHCNEILATRLKRKIEDYRTNLDDESW